MGAIYRISDRTRVGVMVKNLVGFSFNNQYNAFSVPRYATLALSHVIGSTLLSLDSEYIFGHFGGVEKQSANIWFLRGGAEFRLTRRIRLRAGLVYPAVAETSGAGDIKADIPWPGIGASLGIGVVMDRFDIDLALYGDAARSYVEQSPKIGATGTIAYKF